MCVRRISVHRICARRRRVLRRAKTATGSASRAVRGWRSGATGAIVTGPSAATISRVLPQNNNDGVRGFRDVMADADDLGAAAAQANRSARRTYANVPSPTPEFDRLEPSMEDRSGESEYAAQMAQPRPTERPYSFDELPAEAERYQGRRSRGRSRRASGGSRC